MDIIQLSVRDLVEFLCREGDIDASSGAGPSREAMNAGSRMHRKIQRQMGSSYRAEVSLSYAFEGEGYVLQLDGRADGIFSKDTVSYIDEIKGVYRSLEYIREPVKVHEAQAKCYAYIYATQNDCQQIGVQMTYVNLESEAVKRFETIYSYNEIEEWFYEVMEAYRRWVVFEHEHREARNTSIKDKEFPYPYRLGQRDMTVAAYTAIYRKKRLFVQAPTGIGKTMAAVYPAVKAMGEGLNQKIFYLTAKTIAGSVARDAVAVLQSLEIKVSYTVITAKEKICPQDGVECNPEACPYAKGHYDRINDAIYDCITHDESLTRECILSYSKKHMVCPFEFNLDLSLFTDMIICDYNYAFDPRVNLKRYFGDGVKGSYVLLVDEAHNLVDRARSMYSASLCKEDFLQLKKEVKTRFPRLAKYLGQCNTDLLDIKKLCETYVELEDIGPIYLKLMRVQAEFEKILDEYRNQKSFPCDKEMFMNLYFEILQFLNIYKIVDDGYVIYGESVGKNFYLRLFCVHTGNPMKEALAKAQSAIFFSATLLPVFYYKELLGAGEDDYAIYIPSPFSKENRRILIGKDVTTRYQRRGQAEYERIASYIIDTVNSHQGNYMVFFPSYQMLEEVFTIYDRDNVSNEYRNICQNNHMSEADREEFLAAFEQNDNIVAFCIMGGIFSEGIDLTAEKLIGAIVVGCGLPMVCNEQEIIMKYFDAHGGNGFSYAYMYPGMNKVEQAAGRVIRTEQDQGVIVLLDERLTKQSYVSLFPQEWDDYQPVYHKQLVGELSAFWEKVQGNV